MIKKEKQIRLNKSLFSLLAILFILSSCEEKKPKLPFIGNYDLIYKKVDGQTITDTVYPTIPKFTYLNEDSVIVTNETFKNKVWIAEFFFATCPTICPIMNSQLKNLNNETKEYANHIQFLSFTINPSNDKPSVLKEYRKKNGIRAKNWTLLTGDEASTHRLGIENFQIFAGRDAEAEGGYAHSGSFTLVDKKGYVRGVYAVTNFDGTVNKNEYKRLKKELIELLKYEYNIEK
ncbi:MAG: SCO family protein [Bacteroidetes bacterium]|nr:SCO family protein [Bacteroidota bacterium]